MRDLIRVFLPLAALCASSCTSVHVSLRAPGLANHATRPYQDEGSTTSEESSVAEQNSELAKKTQNPIADLISLPLQNNTFFGTGLEDRTANTLFVQPVIPTKLSEDWLLINRIILPIVSQPGVTAGQSTESGLGDTVYTGFLAPNLEGKWTIGVGPALQIPTHTKDRLGNSNWGLGPSVVVVGMLDKWVVGGLINNIWSIGGSSDPDYNQMMFQPFANYNLGQGWYLVTAPIITANWEAASDQAWTVPVGGGGGKTFRIGKQPINVNLQAYYNVEKPTLAGDWSLRFLLQFIL